MPRARDKAGVAERRRLAVELRLGGQDYAAIAAELGFAGRQGAYQAVQEGLAESLREPSRQLRQVECLRLDRLTEPLWKLATAGDLDAVDRLLRVMARRAALLGLDAPAKLAVRDETRPPRRLEIPGADPRVEVADDERPGPPDSG